MPVYLAWIRDTQNVGYINYDRVMWSDHSYSYDDSAYQVRENFEIERDKRVWGLMEAYDNRHAFWLFLCLFLGPPCPRQAKRGRRRIRFPQGLSEGPQLEAHGLWPQSCFRLIWFLLFSRFAEPRT